MDQKPQPALAPAITRAASRQSYYTIRFLVDRDRVADAYRAYAYFRWVDDFIDSGQGPVQGGAEGDFQARQRIAFVERQKDLLERCYRGEAPGDLTDEERMLARLIRGDHERCSGLQAYLRNMMAVMEFDARRRGRSISQTELNGYTRRLAIAVTEALHYFIGHDDHSPHDETRYLAVSAAHITHMLRDACADIEAGYTNIPREAFRSHPLTVHDVQSDAYRAWVRSRVRLARSWFSAGKGYLRRVENVRCRLAGFLYTARFEWVLDAIEREQFHLRPDYADRKRPGAGLQIGLLALSSVLNARGPADAR